MTNPDDINLAIDATEEYRNDGAGIVTHVLTPEGLDQSYRDVLDRKAQEVRSQLPSHTEADGAKKQLAGAPEHHGGPTAELVAVLRSIAESETIRGFMIEEDLEAIERAADLIGSLTVTEQYAVRMYDSHGTMHYSSPTTREVTLANRDFWDGEVTVVTREVLHAELDWKETTDA
ncbi:hypothetical protein ACFVAJ_17275 [Agromyces sp. NPDC057679]|uniref:hypothetical protein n=1 Tax=Agromyces sp. NPDC057679 TaxID=3346207 RepID=UPI003671AB4C